MGKLRVMMRLWQGYALKVSLATSKTEFLYKYKSDDIPDIYMNKRGNPSNFYFFIVLNKLCWTTNYEKLKSNVILF